jgi:hypothetical protein
MEKEIQIIEQAIFEFEESGRASKTAMARFVIGKLNESGYNISKVEDVILTTEPKLCIDCKKPLPKDMKTRCYDCYDYIYFPR